jgi:hypothetical protein
MRGTRVTNQENKKFLLLASYLAEESCLEELWVLQGQQLQQHQRQHRQLAAVLPHQLLALLLLLLGQAWLLLVLLLLLLLLGLLLQASLRALPLLLLLHLLLGVAGLCHQLVLMGWESVLSHMHLHSSAHDERCSA